MELDIINTRSDFTELSLRDWDILERIKNHYDYEVRLYLCEILSQFYCQRSETILLFLLNDSEKLVVASACDALSLGNTSEVLSELKKCSNSKDYVVRGYAYMSIGEIINKNNSIRENFDFLTASIAKEKSIWVKACISYALCINGFTDDYLIYIENLLFNRFYNYRLFALNLLRELIKYCDSPNNIIIEKLLLKRSNEINMIVTNKIDNLLCRINPDTVKNH